MDRRPLTSGDDTREDKEVATGSLSNDPRAWKHAGRAWRIASRVTPRHVDVYLRFRTARRMPAALRARFRAMRLPDELVDRTLADIRSLAGWMDAWNAAAHRSLGEARREDTAHRWQEAAEARRNAAMCYHAAHLITDADPRTLRNLRSSSVTVFAQAAPRLFPETRRLAIPWRTQPLPAYFAKPEQGRPPFPLAVLLNGATTSKEELLLWSEPLLESGLAVLCLDWPGTGELCDLPLSADCDDLTDGLFDLLATEPDLDPAAVALVGFSLGGAVAVQTAALDRRIAAVVAVTPPYDARPWWSDANPLVQSQLGSLAGDDGDPGELIDEFSLVEYIPRLRAPLLIFGAGRDLVVPPAESQRLANAAGELATLVWYPHGSHGLYEEIDDWTNLTGAWLRELFAQDADGAQSTQVDQPAAVVESDFTPVPEAPDLESK